MLVFDVFLFRSRSSEFAAFDLVILEVLSSTAASNAPIDSDLDLTLTDLVDYQQVDEKVSGGCGTCTDKTNNTDVIDIRTGVRSNIGPVELRGFVSLGTFDGEDSTEGRAVVYTVGGQYNFTQAWSVGADVNVGDAGPAGADSQIDMYVRWSF